jgi:hypothetical protein
MAMENGHEGFCFVKGAKPWRSHWFGMSNAGRDCLPMVLFNLAYPTARFYSKLSNMSVGQ